MRTIFVTAAAISAMSSAANAADLARVRPYPARLPVETSVYLGWSGFYIGVNAGGGIANSKSDFSVAGGTPFASVNNYLPGAVGGGQAGFNWQTGPAVVGLETDIQASSLKGGIMTPCAGGLCGLPLSASYNQNLPWFGTVRGRVGVAESGWLIYATAGWAYARIETDASASAPGATATFSLHETRNGWTAGGGIEVAFAPSWSAKLEDLYLDFGNVGTTMSFAALPIADDAHFTMNVVRAGVNYRF